MHANRDSSHAWANKTAATQSSLKDAGKQCLLLWTSKTMISLGGSMLIMRGSGKTFHETASGGDKGTERLMLKLTR